jgi:MFS family permease
MIGRRFIALYTLANIGAYVAFIPLLQILLPLRATAIDPTHGALLLSRVALWGAVAASVGNIVFGALSDRTRSRRGHRVPWLLGGLGATLLAYAVIWWARDPAGLLLGLVGFQLAFNALFAPLGAVLADDVPDRQKGMVSALLGLGNPLGSIIGAVCAGALAVSLGARFLLIAAIVAALILPFAWRLARQASPPRPRAKTPLPDRFRIRPLRHLNFTRAIGGRFLVMTAFSLMQGYLLLYLQHLARHAGFFRMTPEAAFAHLAVIATTANVFFALLCGRWSDRAGNRSLFVFAGGAILACGIVAIAHAPDWTALQFCMALYGSGAGIYYAVDMALIVELLPSLQTAGQDLGIVNLSNTVPQIVAPGVALAILRINPDDFLDLLMLGALVAALGAAAVLGIASPARKPGPLP